jgi:hypothetical protein
MHGISGRGVVVMWGAAIQEVNDARDPAELQAALQKRELREYGQRIRREVKEAHKKWPKKASSRRLWQRPDTTYNILSS